MDFIAGRDLGDETDHNHKLLDKLMKRLSLEDLDWVHMSWSEEAQKLRQVLYELGWECCK